MLENLKQAWKSRTIRTAMIMAVLGVVELNFQVLSPLLGEYYGMVFLIFSVLMTALRIATTKPLADK